MKKLALIGLLLAAPALATPPYDVTINVVEATSGGPADSYEAFLDGVSIGAVVLGSNDFPGLLTADGTYTFRVDATNVAGTTASDPVSITTLTLNVPGKVTITVDTTCSGPCVVTQQ